MPPDADHLDEYDYRANTVMRHRWHPDRRPGRPALDDVAALSDESLYRPALLGEAGASVTRVVAGSDQPFTLWFRAGPAGISPGTEVRFVVVGQTPLGTVPQSHSPEVPGFVHIRSPHRVSMEPTHIGFRVVDGDLKPGDAVTIEVGRAAGFRWTPLAGRKEFIVVIDRKDGSPKQRLPEPVVITVIPEELDHLEVLLPPTRRPGAPIHAAITIRDRFDNRIPIPGPASLSVHDECVAVPLCDGLGHVEMALPLEIAERRMQTGRAEDRNPKSEIRKMSSWKDPQSESAVVRAQATFGKLRTRSNPCVTTEGLQLFIGDLHCHDLLCPAEGYSDLVYTWAREEKRLDFLSVPVQAHAYQDNEKWTIAKYMNERYLDEGHFVTFLGFEWQHSHYGDKVVHYLGGDQPYLPVDQEAYNTPAKLYRALRHSDAFIISHHPGYPLDRHVPGTKYEAMETDVDRLVEIWSMHGSSEGYDERDRPMREGTLERSVMTALRGGLRVGLIAGSDSHSARPGGSAKEPRPYWGGLAAVWAEALTRRKLFEALLARRTYALTGSRIILKMTVNGAFMGSELPRSDECDIEVSVWAPKRIQKIEIIKNGCPLHTEVPLKDECHLSYLDRPEAESGRTMFYHCRVTQQDGHLAVCSPVWVG